MTNIRGSAAQGAGAAQGFNTGFSPEREASRAAARTTREARQQELNSLRATTPTVADHVARADANSLALENALEGQKQIQRQNNNQITIRAFERYDQGGQEARHLNSMLKDLEANGGQMFKDFARFDNITEADSELMEQAGVTAQDLMVNDPDVSPSYIKVTMKDGTQRIEDLDLLKGATGYNKYATDQELARQKTAAEIAALSAKQYGTDARSREAFRRTVAKLGSPDDAKFDDTFTEEYDSLTEDSRGGTRVEREASDRARENGTAYLDELDKIITRDRETSQQKNLTNADDARDSLDKKAGGDFFAVDFSTATPRDRAKYAGDIAAIEKGAGAEFSTKAISDLERVKQLTSQGDAASELTNDQTGLIDRVFRRISRYISNNVEGVRAESAFAAYRNSARNAMFGATLPVNEERSFAEALGGLGQQRGPILAQFRQSMEEVRDTYATLAATNDPYVMHYRAGMDGIKLNDVLEALDERIAMIDRLERGESTNLAVPAPGSTGPIILTPERKAGLEALRGGF